MRYLLDFDLKMRSGQVCQTIFRENKVHQLYSIMQTSQQEGMITLDKSIENLIIKGLINPITK